MDVAVVGEATTVATIHHLPFQIHMNGPARVSTYFLPTCADNKDTATPSSATFRGRLLAGHDVSLFENTVGLVVQETAMQQHARREPVANDATVTTPAIPSVPSHQPSSANVNARHMMRRTAGSGGYGQKAAASSDDDEQDGEDGVEDIDENVGNDARQHRSLSRCEMTNAVDCNPHESSEEMLRTWRVVAGFDKITYWHHDRPVAGSDMVRTAKNWFELAQALHGSDSANETELQDNHNKAVAVAI